MATGSRAGTHVLSLLKETTAFKTREATFEADKLSQPSWDLDPKFARETIENQAVKVDFGEQKPGVGLTYTGSELTASVYAEGQITARTSTIAEITALGHAVASCLGGTPAHSTGDLTGLTTSVTQVQQTTADNHTKNSLVPFSVAADSKTYMRPVGNYSTDTMDLLMALPTAPAASTDVIYGATTIKDSESAGYIIQGDAIGNNAHQSYNFYGAVGNFSIPEAAPGEAQTLSFTWQCAKFEHNGTSPAPTLASQVAPSPARPIVAAGGEFLIANHGSTATTELSVLRASIETGRTYVADPDANDEDGLCGWIPTDQELRLTLTVKDADTPPSGGASTWRGAWESADHGTDNDFHVLLVFGQTTAGSLLGLYFPRCHLIAEPEDTDVDGLAARKLTFASTQGAFTPAGASSPAGDITTNIWVGIG
jgi:hypothetical protein